MIEARNKDWNDGFTEGLAWAAKVADQEADLHHKNAQALRTLALKLQREAMASLRTLGAHVEAAPPSLNAQQALAHLCAAVREGDEYVCRACAIRWGADEEKPASAKCI